MAEIGRTFVTAYYQTFDGADRSTLRSLYVCAS